MPIDQRQRARMVEVLQDFRVLVRSMRRHYQWVEERIGIGGAQLWTLSEIAASPGLKASALADQLAIHRSTASNMLKKLVTLGLVTRDRTGHDQREVRLHLTRKGKQILRRAPRPSVGVLQQALLDLPFARLDALGKEVRELVRVMRRKDEKARGKLLSNL